MKSARVSWLAWPFVLAWAVVVVFPKQTFAQVQYATNSATVTATVEDNAPPSTPILVSPSNNSYVTTNTPYFVWEGSTDDNGISHYRLSLDGSTLFDNIPTSNTSNSQYTLTYNSITNRYTLIPASGFSQGSHTWRVGAYDTLNNLSESATWTFIIDTQAPTFVMTQLGDQSVSISAQDAGTIPVDPIELGANEPLLAGTGESNSTVQLTLTIPGDPTQNFSFSVSSGGSWSQQLGILPRDVTMTLDFTITDVAGNVSVLSGVRFVIPTQVIIVPSPSPSSSAAASPGTSTPPSSEPGSSSTPEATPPSAPISVTIPVIPPREILNEVVQELTERLVVGNVLVQALPPEVRQLVRDSLSTVAPVSAVVATTAVPVVATFALASQFGSSLSVDVLAKILQALGLLPAGKPQGMVFESNSYEPVAFAVLNIVGKDQEAGITETVVTDVAGIYKGIKIPPGTYTVSVSHQDYTFPSHKNRPSYLTVAEFYQGQAFQVSGQGQEQLLLIPVDKNTELARKDWKRRSRVLAAQLSRRTSTLIWPVFILSLFLAALFPTVWNLGMSVLYSTLVGRKILLWFRTPLLTGMVVDEHGQPISRAIIRLSLQGSDELTSLIATAENGRFTVFAPKGKYELNVTKPGYIWYDQSSPLSSYVLDASQTSQSLMVTMKPAQAMYDELGLV